MRLPYLQVTQETWVRARQLGALLSVSRHEALGLILDMWAWAVDLGPKTEAPSGRINSPRAILLLAGALEWRGNPAELVQALVDVELLEATATGLRVRGLDRYRTTWDKNRRRPLPAEMAADSGIPPVPELTSPAPAPEPELTSAGPAGKPERKTQTQTQTQMKKKEPPPTSSAEPPELSYQREEEEEIEPFSWQSFWAFTQACRLKRGLQEEARPDKLPAWHQEANARAGPGLGTAYGRYLEDPAFEARGWPIRVFMSDAVWRQRVPSTAEPEAGVRL